jgi:hypothetical protein
MAAPVLPPIGDNVKAWGNNLTAYLRRQLPRLYFKTADDNPSENGVILWDDEAGYPVVSKGGEFRQVILEGGHATFIRSTDVTAASANTAYSITYDAPSGNFKIDRDATNNERIVFEEGGEYLISFTAEIRSSSGSDVTFYFWPAINGTNVTGSTMVNTLHQNGANLVVSRAAIFDVNDDDYLEVKWAVSNTHGSLNATAATSFAPASPASTLAITRIHA